MSAEIRKSYDAAHVTMILGVVSGLFYREFTKVNHFIGETQLALMHTHLLALGTLGVLVVQKRYTNGFRVPPSLPPRPPLRAAPPLPTLFRRVPALLELRTVRWRVLSGGRGAERKAEFSQRSERTCGGLCEPRTWTKEA
ncbi:DUF2871 family protein [Sorangium sp. So ce764]|uniref:DUF2871 family protein n=1 Tax=Sorangium sp. So ce764 TaxID=3133320 RepID=UPI003F5D8766